MNNYGNYNFGYGYEYYNPTSGIDAMADSIFVGIITIYLIIILIGLVVTIVDYVLRGIGMYTIAKREGMEYPWLAFVPFARTYLQGELSGTVHLKKKQIKNPGIWLIVLPFIAGAVSLIFYAIFWITGIGMIISMDYMGISVGAVTGLVIFLIIAVIFMVLYEAVYKVLRVLVNRQIYDKFTSPNMAVAHAILGILLPLYESICIFVMRNRPYNPGKEPDLGTPFMTSPPPVPPVNPVEPQVGPKTEMSEGIKTQDEDLDAVEGDFRPVKEYPVGEFQNAGQKMQEVSQEEDKE